MAITSTPTVASGAAATASAASAASDTVAGATIAQNFTTFLQLLTTQLKNQNPLEPLDTNQFTQQLVQFAGVEQQMNANKSLTTLISLQQNSQTTAAMSFLGSTVSIEGSTARLADGAATWTYSLPKAATASIDVQSASGDVVYSTTRTLTAGAQSFVWDGRNLGGIKLADGDYKIAINAKDASGQTVAVSTQVNGVVDGVDLTQTPPRLSIGNQSYTMDQIKQVRSPAKAS
jgi:flagellar basal-body rod modification protein FlgD